MNNWYRTQWRVEEKERKSEHEAGVPFVWNWSIISKVSHNNILWKSRIFHTRLWILYYKHLVLALLYETFPFLGITNNSTVIIDGRNMLYVIKLKQLCTYIHNWFISHTRLWILHFKHLRLLYFTKLYSF